MTFKNGKSGNPNGRPVGSENKLTTRAKYYINKLLDEFDRRGIEKLVETGELKDLINLLTKILPTNAKIEHDGEITIKLIKKILNGKNG